EKGRLAATNTSDAAARSLGDICLLVVRAHLHRSDPAAARRQMLECLRLLPDLAPSPDMHPPDVLALAAAVQSESKARLIVARSRGRRHRTSQDSTGARAGRRGTCSLRLGL